jgi:hypothetical protein
MLRNPCLCKFRKGHLEAAEKADSPQSSSDLLESSQKHIHPVPLKRTVHALNVKSTSGTQAMDHVSIELEEFERRRPHSDVDDEKVHVGSPHDQLTSSQTRPADVCMPDPLVAPSKARFDALSKARLDAIFARVPAIASRTLIEPFSSSTDSKSHYLSRFPTKSPIRSVDPFSSSTDSIPQPPPRSRSNPRIRSDNTVYVMRQVVPPTVCAEAAAAVAKATVPPTVKSTFLTAAVRNASTRAKQRSSGLDFAAC